METSHCDALVFFGATGDLAYKKISPALQAMVRQGQLSVPIIGIAKADWNLDQLKARAKDSLEKHGGVDPVAFATLTGLLRYVDGDYKDAALKADTPVFEYEPVSWGPREVERLTPPGGWQNPVA